MKGDPLTSQNHDELKSSKVGPSNNSFFFISFFQTNNIFFRNKIFFPNNNFCKKKFRVIRNFLKFFDLQKSSSKFGPTVEDFNLSLFDSCGEIGNVSMADYKSQISSSTCDLTRFFGICDLEKPIQRVPALRTFWDLEKTVLHEICVSGTVLWSPTNANSPTYTYISQKTC